MSNVQGLWRPRLERDGFVLLPAAMPEKRVDWMCRHVRLILQRKAWGEKKMQAANPVVMRDLLRFHGLFHVVCSERPLGPILLDLLGEDCGVVQVLWLSKPPGGRSWFVPWHRDEVFPVLKHVALDGGFPNPP